MKEKYEKLYRDSLEVCGQPSVEVTELIQNLPAEQLRVLDLGCGQGRDALLAARRGFRVTGVDISATGIRQMLEISDRDNLDIVGVVADLETWQAEATYDVVILDRILHMLDNDEKRESVLTRAFGALDPGGLIVIVDMAQNIPQIRSFLLWFPVEWEVIHDRKGHLYLKRGGIST